MSKDLTREQIVDLLYYLGASEVKDYQGKDNIQYTCTVHGETNPSAGVSVSKQLYSCFACGSRGGIVWLTHQSNTDKFPSMLSARKFLEKRYKLSFDVEDEDNTPIKRRLLNFGERASTSSPKEETLKVLPRKALAPFRSGKETYKYFYTRGFDSKSLVKFEVGRDLKNKTVTVPIRNEKSELVGFVGRFIDPNRAKNERYMVYEFKRGHLTFPQDKLEVEDNTIILVEGLFDAMWLHMLGFKNVQALLGNRITKHQAKFLKTKARKFIRMFDSDKGGEQAKDMYNTIMSDVVTYDVEYPEGYKDPQELNKEQILEMLKNKKSPLKYRLKKLD